MFFNPRLTKELGSKIAVTASTEVIIPKCAAENYIKTSVEKRLITCGRTPLSAKS